MDGWLERYAAALAQELGASSVDDEDEEGWPEPEQAGADVAAWSASPHARARYEAMFSALDDDAAESLLELARVVAHGTERRFAPLSTFLAGQFVAIRVAQGAEPAAAAEEARAIAERLLS